MIQFYSNTLGGVIADNDLQDVNVLNGGNVGNASVGAYGACYNGPGSVWYTEFLGNRMVRSDGIALLDQQVERHGGVNQANCPAYAGAYIRWAVVRRNQLSGISAAQRPQNRCASVTNSNRNSSDLISEHNAIDCPAGGVTVNANGEHLPWTNFSCLHCVTRPAAAAIKSDEELQIVGSGAGVWPGSSWIWSPANVSRANAHYGLFDIWGAACIEAPKCGAAWNCSTFSTSGCQQAEGAPGIGEWGYQYHNFDCASPGGVCCNYTSASYKDPPATRAAAVSRGARARARV